MATKVQLRRGTSAEWSSANPVLAEGEIGIDTTQGRGKIGDGSTAWNSLSFEFQGPPGVGWTWITAGWATATGYSEGDTLTHGNSVYVALSDHTSGASTEPGVGGSWETVWALVIAGASGDMTAAVYDAAGKAEQVLTESDLLDEDNMASDSATKMASQQSIVAYVAAQIANLINSAPGALDTLDELAAALGDDANFAATMTTALAGKQPLDSDLTAIAALTTTTFGRAFLAMADEAAFKAAVNLEIGTDVQAYDADTLKGDVADQVITGGARVTPLDLGTVTTGTTTPDPGDRALQKMVNGGASTIAPGSNYGSYVLDITNNASAGALTTSGWTKKSGDAFTTTNGHKFRCYCTISDVGSTMEVRALQ